MNTHTEIPGLIFIKNQFINENVCAWKHNAFTKHKGNKSIFIESGTHHGGGIASAFAANFDKIYSIEILEKNYLIAKERWKDINNVNLYCGDTSQTIESILNIIQEPSFFWLDAHFNVGSKIPTYEELKFIGNHYIKNHTILVDDVSLYFDVNELEQAIKDINPNYDIIYEQTWRSNKDILVAKIN